jgi:hypothetical protein
MYNPSAPTLGYPQSYDGYLFVYGGTVPATAYIVTSDGPDTVTTASQLPPNMANPGANGYNPLAFSVIQQGLLGELCDEDSPKSPLAGQQWFVSVNDGALNGPWPFPIQLTCQ